MAPVLGELASSAPEREQESVKEALCGIWTTSTINTFVELQQSTAEGPQQRGARRRAQSGACASVPFAVKNLYDVAGLATIAGSRINRDRPPAAGSAALVAASERRGGQSSSAPSRTTSTGAPSLSTENTHHGPTRNPHDPSRVAGGGSQRRRRGDRRLGWFRLALTNGSIECRGALREYPD